MEKLNQEQFDDLTRRVASDIKSEPSLRYGQSMYNNLFDINPKLAENIRNTENDPFYQDSVLPNFFKAILDDFTYLQLNDFLK